MNPELPLVIRTKMMEVDSVSSPGSSKEVRNWLELPPDVLFLIFHKLGAVDILLRAQAVCSSWRMLSKDTELYHCIDFRNRWDLFDGDINMEKVAREAVDRSCGKLVEFSVEHFATNDFMRYVMDKSSPLRCLRVVSCYQVSNDVMIGMAKKYPLLEELEICHCTFSKEVLEAFGQSCPQLKYFRLNIRGYKRPRIECDEDALAIAANMPQLRRLHLFGNKLTDTGLRAILDSCQYLKYVDLRQCFNVNLEEDLKQRCANVSVELRLPEDPTDDYEFDAQIEEYGSSNEDYPSGFSEIDFLSDDGYYEFSEGSYYSDDFDYDDDEE